MSLVNVINVAVLDNPSAFTNPFQFEITFECIQQLEDDLEWKVIYVGSAENSNYDQVLEEVCVGPISVGINKFVLQAPAPDPSKIINEDLIGVTVVLVICSYNDQEFVRIGYYVNNEYNEPFDPENPPNPVDISRLYRNILHLEPRVTRFAINWFGEGILNVIPEGEQQGALVGEEEQEIEASDDMEEEEEDDGVDEEDEDDEEEDEEDDNREVDLVDEEPEEDDEGEGEGEDEEDFNMDDEADVANEDGVNESEYYGEVRDDQTEAHMIAIGEGEGEEAHQIIMNEDSMDVGMMQQNANDNAYSNFSNQSIY